MKLYLSAVLVLLVGCQQNSEQLPVKESHSKNIINKTICQEATTPPLKNTQKLKEMLIANGKIDASLPDEEIERAVKDYIRKKNAAYKNCRK